MKKRILVVDDEPSMREMLAIMLFREGYEVAVAESRATAAAALAVDPVDMVITDVKLPDGDGIEILRHVKSASPQTVVVIMTAFSSTETAVAALKLGAHDYVIKPFDVEELKIVVRGALESQDLRQDNVRLRAQLRSQHALERIVGVSPAISALMDLVKLVAPTTSTVLISGESGTGKELVARAIHALSPRRDEPFVSVNCAALTETLLESELFGHVKGAFTDAHQNKKGLFEAAHRGSLFLDEVGETPPAMQVKLLRALQERKVRRVGGTAEVEVDVRVIAATNVPLEDLVGQHRLRDDLYYRLSVIPVHLPPLRARREDIPILANHFLERFRSEMGKNIAKISDAAMERLLAHSWPGNVRELENAIERAVALEVTAAVLPERLPTAIHSTGSAAPVRLGDGFSLDDHLRALELDLLRQALSAAAGDRSRACELLGITPRSLRYLIQKHGIQGDKNWQA